MPNKISLAALALTGAAAFRPPTGSAPWHKEGRENEWFKPDWPINYYVPDFGVDHDIIHTQKHIADQEARLKHNWQPKFDKDTEKFVVPTAHEFKLVQMDDMADLQTTQELMRQHRAHLKHQSLARPLHRGHVSSKRNAGWAPSASQRERH